MKNSISQQIIIFSESSLQSKKETQDAIAFICSQIQSLNIHEKATLYIQLNDLKKLNEEIMEYIKPDLTEFAHDKGEITINNKKIVPASKKNFNYKEDDQYILAAERLKQLETALKDKVSFSTTKFIQIK